MRPSATKSERPRADDVFKKTLPTIPKSMNGTRSVARTLHACPDGTMLSL